MNFLKNFKKVSVFLFCAVAMLCIGILTTNFKETSLQNNKAYASTNSAVVYRDENSLGSFVDGYVYQYTNHTKIDNFKNGTEASDVSTIAVNSNATFGSQLNPYVILTVEDWDKFVKQVAVDFGSEQYFVLGADLDFENINFHPVAIFNGTFYGMGNNIKNVNCNNWVYYNATTKNYEEIGSTNHTANGLGLFCKSTSATIADLNLENINYSNITTATNNIKYNVGGIIGYADGTTNIVNCQLQGNIGNINQQVGPETRIGGLVGILYCNNFIAYRSFVNINITCYSSRTNLIAGGIVGSQEIGKAYFYDNFVAMYSDKLDSDYIHSSLVIAVVSGTCNVDGFMGYMDITSNVIGGSGTVMGFANSANASASNVYVDAKFGPISNKQYGYAFAGIVGIKSQTNCNMVFSGSYASLHPAISEKDTCTNFSSSNELISNAQSNIGIGLNADIWNFNNGAVVDFSQFSINNNPVVNMVPQSRIVNTTFSTTYNGKRVDLENFYSGISVEGVEGDMGIDAGTYVFTVKLNNENLVFYNLPETTRTTLVTVNIKKAPLSFSQLQIDEYGKLIGLSENQTVSEFLASSVRGEIYSHDSEFHTPPEFVLQYQKAGGSWSETLPTTAGNWYVRASLKNADNSNYILTNDGQTAFNRAKERISIPYFYNSNPDIEISNSTTNVFYSGSKQVFLLVNNASNNSLSGISVIDSSRTPGLLYSQSTGEYSVTSFGTFSVDVKLADTTNTQWADDSPSTTKTITLIVKPADLVVTIDEASKTSWVKGERGFKILVYVDGIKGNDAVKFDATYGEVGGNEVLYVPENNINLDPNNETRMIIAVDTTNIPIGVEYFLSIALKNGVAVNGNYNLVNDMGNWNFLITNSLIKKEDITIVWSYSNIRSGTVNFDNISNGSVPYNEYEYTIGLNPTLLHSGVKVYYSGRTVETNSNNSQVYTITAVLSPKEGYGFENDVITSYTFSWNITPIECDLSNFVWAQNFDYDGTDKTMTILNLPSWLTNTTIYSNNTGNNSGDYTAICTVGLTQYGNHIFINSTNSPEISITSNGRSATLTHAFKINKAIIQVSNFADLWLVKTIKNKVGDPIDLRIPTAIGTYANQLILKYYTDSSCNVEIDPVDMELKRGSGSTTLPTTYYAKVWLNDDAQFNYKQNYKIKNVSDDSIDYAVLQFNVGGIRAIIKLTVDTLLVYNGQIQSVNITSNNVEYNNLVSAGKATYEVKYYAVVDDLGNYDSSIEVEPKHSGKYVAVIFVKDLDETDTSKIVDEFVVYNHAHYFEITQLKLTTNWTFTPNGNTAIPVEGVTANANVNVKDFYNYTIYDSTGTNIVLKEDLAFNTKYIARLSIKDTSTNSKGLANVVILDANDDVAFTNTTEYAFTTGQNPEAPAVVLDNPEIFGVTNIVYDKNSHKIVIRIRDNVTNTYISNILDYVTIELKNNFETASIADVDIMSQTNAGIYTYIIKIKESANASWLWGEKGLQKEVTFTIDKKPIVAPSLKTEYEWKGETINVWTNDSIWLDWVNVTGTYLATDISTNSVNFELKDKVNTFWDNRTLVDSGKQNEDINLSWSIVKVKITGQWKENEKGYLNFVLDNANFNNLIEIKYLNADGVEVKPENFVEGESYTVTVKVKDSEHYEFIAQNEAYEELKSEFKYKKPLSFFEKVSNFIKSNWVWFVIAAICLILLLIIVIVLKIIKKKKQAKLQSQNGFKNGKFDEANSINNSAYPSMPYPMPPYYTPVPPQYPSLYDSHLIKEIEELKEQVKTLTKFNLASQEERNQNARLARVENMLMQFLMNNFANNPNWIPFNNQDMVNYDINDLMKIYAKAKQAVSNNISNNLKAKQQILLEEEAEGFENKVLEYNKQKTDSQYIELLKELRDRISKVEEKLEEDKKERAENELEKTKQELAKSQAELEKKQTEVENLKEQTKQHENEKLIEQLTKRNETQEIAEKANLERLEFNEAFNSLPEEQKKYFNVLKAYALQQPQAKVKLNKFNLAIGAGNSSYIKFAIKRNTLYAYFGTTEIKLEDGNSVQNAKNQIDVCVQDVKKLKDK